MGLGTVVAFVNGARRERVRARTAQGDFMTYLWVGFGVLVVC